MHWIDYFVFVIYFLGMAAFGYYFYRKNKDAEDYYVGGRSMNSIHIGLSVVATDVGGGFSIGLGGLGFTMGISGSWMLFTGLIGAWLAAVLLIPKVYPYSRQFNFLTFPQFLENVYGARVALLAGIISAIGYTGFTSSQLLAGAKLASATFIELDLTMALIIMGVIAVGYTVIGGLKAVIYTDTVQWIILLAGLIFIGIPLGYQYIGGWESIQATLPPEMLRLDNIEWGTFFNWLITIVPIWFIGMTLYQRIYASKSEQSARCAWYIAGIFEYPFMAFMGVILGLFARVAVDQGMFAYAGYDTAGAMDAEMGLPMLLRTILPAGLMGLMLSAYFSAIMSTADSCLMAASGNLVTDVLEKVMRRRMPQDGHLNFSQWITFAIGAFALLLALNMQNVLELMLLSYAFMVSGLFVPTVASLFFKKVSSIAAFWSMLLGGTATTILALLSVSMPYGLDANAVGISVSFLVFVLLNFISNQKGGYEE